VACFLARFQISHPMFASQKWEKTEPQYMTVILSSSFYALDWYRLDAEVMYL